MSDSGSDLNLTQIASRTPAPDTESDLDMDLDAGSDTDSGPD